MLEHTSTRTSVIRTKIESTSHRRWTASGWSCFKLPTESDNLCNWPVIECSVVYWSLRWGVLRECVVVYYYGRCSECKWKCVSARSHRWHGGVEHLLRPTSGTESTNEHLTQRGALLVRLYQSRTGSFICGAEVWCTKWLFTFPVCRCSLGKLYPLCADATRWWVLCMRRADCRLCDWPFIGVGR